MPDARAQRSEQWTCRCGDSATNRKPYSPWRGIRRDDIVWVGTSKAPHFFPRPGDDGVIHDNGLGSPWNLKLDEVRLAGLPAGARQADLWRVRSGPRLLCFEKAMKRLADPPSRSPRKRGERIVRFEHFLDFRFDFALGDHRPGNPTGLGALSRFGQEDHSCFG